MVSRTELKTAVKNLPIWSEVSKEYSAKIPRASKGGEFAKCLKDLMEKGVIPDNYIPAPRSISEALQLLESLRLPDGRTVFESDRFWEKLNELAQKYRPPQKGKR